MNFNKIQQFIFFSFSFFCIVPSSYAQEYDDYIGAGHYIGVSTSSSDDNAGAMKTVDGTGHDLDIQGSSRFLAHATLGYTIEDIENLSEIGLETWIDQQQEIESEYITLRTIQYIFQMYNACIDQLGPACLLEFNLDARYFRWAWWDNFMKGEDLLRQRVALALSEILVLSDKSQLNNYPHGIANYYDILSRNAFGNYKDLLIDVTLNPSMGFYLSHINNPKTSETLNIRPDENYAREIMQLFTIGLFELNINGTRKTDPDTGLWIPTYDNEDIQGLAKVFTGLSGSAWADENDNSPVTFGKNFARYSLIDEMVIYPFWHETGPKTIVGDYTIQEGQTGMEDIEEAIDHLFHHDNVGPFLASQLIQRLVKSNPSPQYVERVAQVFNNNGDGERGDLGAMVKAIMMDEEALDCFWFGHERNGMLRAPILRLTQMMKGLKAETESDVFWNTGVYYETFTGQHPMGSPTVFNFYSPNYVPNPDFANEDLVGPEFQILNSSTSSNYVNYMMLALMGEYINDRFGSDFPNIINEPFNIPYTDNQDYYAAQLNDPIWKGLVFLPDQMIDYLDILMANGQLSENTKERIANSVSNEDLFDPRSASLYGLFMLMINPEYVIMK